MGAPERDIAQAKDFIAPPGYQRHRPEATLLYRLVAEHYSGRAWCADWPLCQRRKPLGRVENWTDDGGVARSMSPSAASQPAS
jgi:hypothetical protein